MSQDMQVLVDVLRQIREEHEAEQKAEAIDAAKEAVIAAAEGWREMHASGEMDQWSDFRLSALSDAVDALREAQK